MSKAEQYKQDEQSLDFEKATEMTVGEATRKSEEIAAGVTEQDSALEKYIKQHRAEIEAGKFGAKQQPSNQLADFIQEQRQEGDFARQTKETAEQEEFEVPTEPAMAASEQSASPANADDAESASEPKALIEAVLDEIPVTTTQEPSTESQVRTAPSPVEEKIEEYDWADEEKDRKRKRYFLYGGLVLAAVVLIGGSIIAYNLSSSRSNSGKVTVSSSSSSKISTSSSSSSSTASQEKAFTDLYNTFFTDDQHTSLKNSSFGELDKLKALLDKLSGTAKYDTYKKQYDDLVKQITAIQSVNAQFKTAAITDGNLDSNAQVKSDAKFSDTTTGNNKLDQLLSSAISQGRSQLAPAPAPQTGGVDTNAASAPAATAPATSNSTVNGVTLQRNLSRVPYNQAALDDVNNPAWNFNPGVLENILNISRQRGYFTGDNYILERVNIINGNGYYNLFRSDGTYLFSINCKTGYFVGNGKGYAEDLDY
ncbi:cell division site-positioning protein MapZ family protein [Streptococcus massiliensis]|uniref:Mid-cell-anchored protein Z n=1 Tax=Streptococcus massiliensis TaxID=313439 RepID=A0A380KZA9_9STRE|nr:cell division site-positioning protein MapZ family protein [Streptococcus massiliensis]SUN76629.1 Holliday junction-specific endonuclease [Streptococcus massiliensis]